MRDNRFRRWSRGHAIRGQQRLADTLRVLIYKTDQQLFEVLNYEDDDCFLDPLLFAWFTAPTQEMPLKKLVRDGRAFGESAKASSGSWLQRSGIRVFSDRHPVLDRFFIDDDSNPVPAQFAEIALSQRKHLSRALDIIGIHCTEVAEDIASTVRGIMLYRASEPNSFATLSAHGAIFLNVPESADEVFFLEDIAHQSAHVVFNAFTLDKEHFLNVHPTTSLNEIFGNREDSRAIYSAFHALYTYTKICYVLSTLRERSVFRGRKAHELLGRLAYTLKKFGHDLALLAKPDIFTAKGWLCYRHFVAKYAYYMSKNGRLIEGVDLSNQPYNFSYERFASSNPIRLPALEVIF